ncbi:hypothetical protein CR513_42066, partial [Mucuna pruriens]
MRRQGQRLASQQFKRHGLVLRKITRTGPFRVSDEVGKGTYCLEQLNGKKILQTWNALDLPLYYS